MQCMLIFADMADRLCALDIIKDKAPQLIGTYAPNDHVERPDSLPPPQQVDLSFMTASFSKGLEF